jgi:hypothetical protein
MLLRLREPPFCSSKRERAREAGVRANRAADIEYRVDNSRALVDVDVELIGIIKSCGYRYL